MNRKHPRFKFWADSYLSDPVVDGLSLEAQGLYVRMLCVCNQRGNIPADPEEIARLTRCRLQSVLQCHSQCKTLFKLQDGHLFSEAMEADKAKSEAARANAEKRYSKETYQHKPANGIASGPANRPAKKVRRLEGKSREGETEEDAHSAESPPDTANAPLDAAYRLFWQLKAPATASLADLAAQAIRYETLRLGSTAQAEESVLKLALKAQSHGESRWQFWFEDGKYR